MLGFRYYIRVVPKWVKPLLPLAEFGIMTNEHWRQLEQKHGQKEDSFMRL